MSAFSGAKRHRRWSLLGGLLLWATGWAHAGTVHYYYTDPQGTVLAKADAQGHILATYDYAPYGSQALGTPPDGPGYTGHVNDPESGLVYMQARYYDPAVGRFVSTDPVGPIVGNVFNFNRFAYANNNPVVNMDPDGRCTGTLLCGNGEGVGGVGNVVGMTFVMPGRGEGGGSTAAQPQTESGRPLTKNEASGASEEYPGLNTDVIRIKYDSHSKTTAITLKNTIHFPKSASSCLDFMTCGGKSDGATQIFWFIHEVDHISQFQHGIGPVMGHILHDLFNTGPYLSLEQFRRTPSPDKLHTEEAADWHAWHYLCSHNIAAGC